MPPMQYALGHQLVLAGRFSLRADSGTGTGRQAQCPPSNERISIQARRSRIIPGRVCPWLHIRCPSVDNKVTSCGGGDGDTRTIWLTSSNRCKQYSGESLVTRGSVSASARTD